MDPSEFSSVLDLIYSASTTPGQWPDALAGISQLFRCTCVCLIDRNLRTLEGSICSNFDQESEREFLTNWTERNVIRRTPRVRRPGMIETDQTILPRADFIRSEYFNQFLSPRDMDICSLPRWGWSVSLPAALR